MKITDIYSSTPYIELSFSASEWSGSLSGSLEPEYTVEVRLSDDAQSAITWAYNQMQNIEELKKQMGINPALDQAIKNYQEASSNLQVIHGLLGEHNA